MIVLDEEISFGIVQRPIQRWYPGKVITVRDLRPNARLLDPELPLYLRQLRSPTFVTINYRDFWREEYLHPAYCLICLKLTNDDAARVPDILREILKLPEFNTKAKRMGKIISWTPTEVKFWEL
ncbi:MAG: hypothetical protein ABI977_23135 [Acidobacteriota bacterium]